MTKKYQSITNKLIPSITILILVLCWLFLSEGGIIPGFMLPSPIQVFHALTENFGILMKNTVVTVLEASYGLFIGIIIAFLTATLMDRFNTFNKALYPLLIISQTIPTIAIAPLLVLWMGFGIAPKVTLVVITTFFPVTIGLLDGYKSVDADAVNLLKSMGAGKIKIYRHVRFPSALPGFFSGLKVSASYAIVGALIAEWMGGFEGLGVYMTRVKKAYAFDKMFAVIVLICIISLLLMALVVLLQKMIMPWERKKNR